MNHVQREKHRPSGKMVRNHRRMRFIRMMSRKQRE
jgi:hypothetical protein